MWAQYMCVHARAPAQLLLQAQGDNAEEAIAAVMGVRSTGVRVQIVASVLFHASFHAQVAVRTMDGVECDLSISLCGDRASRGQIRSGMDPIQCSWHFGTQQRLPLVVSDVRRLANVPQAPGVPFCDVSLVRLQASPSKDILRLHMLLRVTPQCT
jgi:hypothetical protein